MSYELKKLIGSLLKDSATVATIATLDEDGAPRSVPSPFLRLDEKGRLVHLELLETSATHRNLLRGIWFDRPVSVTLSGRGGRVLVATGRSHKAHVSGPLFSDYYREVRACLGDADLAAVWMIEPLRVSDETYLIRKEREEALHPFHLHLDRLAVADNQP
ncbi:MAG: pyridoxamine 5'-phosphate oxidase family protein [Desulfuromonadaceae bacterium]